MAEPAIILGTSLLNACAHLKGVNIPYFKRTDVSRLRYIYTHNYPSPRLIRAINLLTQLPLPAFSHYK
jgi:hypothetical protein